MASAIQFEVTSERRSLHKKGSDTHLSVGPQLHAKQTNLTCLQRAAVWYSPPAVIRPDHLAGYYRNIPRNTSFLTRSLSRHPNARDERSARASSPSHCVCVTSKVIVAETVEKTSSNFDHEPRLNTIPAGRLNSEADPIIT